MTPLHLAAERARVKVIEYLVGREADIINIQDRNGVNILYVTVLMMKAYTVCATFEVSRHMRKYICITHQLCILSLSAFKLRSFWY